MKVDDIIIDEKWVKNNYHGEKQFVLPECTTIIGAYAFYECKNLENIVIPDSVRHIGECAFKRCYRLKTIKIPKNIKNLYHGTFMDCGNLYEVKLNDSLYSIGADCFYRCNILTDIILQNSVKEIGRDAFLGCERLCKINLKHVKKIGKGAFQSCNLQNVILSNTLQEIEAFTFSCMDGIRCIEIPSSVWIIDRNAFVNVESDFCLRVEKDSYAEKWAKYMGYAHFTFNGSEGQP